MPAEVAVDLTLCLAAESGRATLAGDRDVETGSAAFADVNADGDTRAGRLAVESVDTLRFRTGVTVTFCPSLVTPCKVEVTDVESPYRGLRVVCPSCPCCRCSCRGELLLLCDETDLGVAGDAEDMLVYRIINESDSKPVLISLWYPSYVYYCVCQTGLVVTA